MPQQLLITKTDFAGRIDISGNLDATKKLNQHILHAQDFDLRVLMGDEFYYDMLARPTDTNYETLLTGGSYQFNGTTINFDGLKVVLVYFAGARLVPNLDTQISAHGMMVKKNEFSDHADTKEKARLANEYSDLAEAYWNKIEKFLINDAGKNYPLWKGNLRGDIKGGKKTKIYGVKQSDNDNDYYSRRRRFW